VKDKCNKLWAMVVIAKAGGRCQLCGSAAMWSDVLDAHHLYPKGSRPHLRFDTDNGICLCRMNCHRKAHDHPKMFLELLKQFAPAKYEWYMANEDNCKGESHDYDAIWNELNDKLTMLRME